MPSSLKKVIQSMNAKYHIIWCPKYRYRVMDGDIRLVCPR